MTLLTEKNIILIQSHENNTILENSAKKPSKTKAEEKVESVVRWFVGFGRVPPPTRGPDPRCIIIVWPASPRIHRSVLSHLFVSFQILLLPITDITVVIAVVVLPGAGCV